MQMLDTIGCGDEFVSKGSKWTCITQATRTAIVTQIPFSRLKPYTRHPYTLIIPQVLTEQILGEKLASLGVTVHRPYRVVGLKPNSNDAKRADVTFEDGQVITAKYIIAADGARSTVRLCCLGTIACSYHKHILFRFALMLGSTSWTRRVKTTKLRWRRSRKPMLLLTMKIWMDF